MCQKFTDAIRSGKYDVIITNFANPDMVGHTGIMDAVVKAIETVDECVGKVVEAVKEVDGVMFICADHGNAEKLIDDNGEPYTAHTTNPVPFILVNYDEAYTLKENGKLCDIIPTLIDIMELEKPAEMTGESDMVTVDEWLATIKGLLNVDMAENTIALKNKLEEFRVKTLVRDSTVSCGDIVIGHENGFRDYASHYEKKKKTLSDELLKSIVKDLSFQEDYYHVLEQIIDFMIEDAKDKAIPAIECYALAKGVSDCETAIEMIRDPENITMVSEYYPWLKKIGAFLKDNPEETKRIEEYAQVKNLEKFFE